MPEEDADTNLEHRIAELGEAERITHAYLERIAAALEALVNCSAPMRRTPLSIERIAAALEALVKLVASHARDESPGICGAIEIGGCYACVKPRRHEGEHKHAVDVRGLA